MAYAYNKTHLQLCHCLCLEMILSISYKALVAVLKKEYKTDCIYTKIKTPILIRKLARNMFIDTKIGLNDVLISFLLFRNKLNYLIIFIFV